MNAILLSIHVLSAVILIGPVTAAASAFPRYARTAVTAAGPQVTPGLHAAAAMHRVSRGYTIPAIAVPVSGTGLASAMGVLSQPWLIASMLLTATAAALLVTRINPAQARILRELGARGHGTLLSKDAARTLASLRRLGMTTGIFAVLWATVVVLMITRPGSSTGV